MYFAEFHHGVPGSVIKKMGRGESPTRGVLIIKVCNWRQDICPPHGQEDDKP